MQVYVNQKSHEVMSLEKAQKTVEDWVLEILKNDDYFEMFLEDNYDTLDIWNMTQEYKERVLRDYKTNIKAKGWANFYNQGWAFVDVLE